MSRFEDGDEEDAFERDVSPMLSVGEGDIDASLRPRSLREFIGQPRVREQLQLVLEGAKNRGGTPDHILLSGPPGLGKTSLAMIIAAELGTMRVTEQIDALVTLSTDPVGWLVSPRLWAALLCVPVLVGVGDIIGIMTGSDIDFSGVYSLKLK